MANFLLDSENNIKLGRCNTSTQDDLYQKCIAMEESEASTRNAEDDVNLLLASCANIKNLMNQIYELKSKKPTYSSDQLLEKVIQATSQVVTLKKVNRLEKIRNASARKNCLTERDNTDVANLQYQNLLYEHAHLKSEFKKCTSTLLEDESKLLRGEVSYNLAALELELAEQKDMAKQCEKLQNEKEEIEAEILELQSGLGELGPKLAAVLESTKPLQEYFGLPTFSTNNMIFFLPDPLYLLFKNVDSYRRVYDNSIVQLEICGDVNAAKRWKSLQGKLCERDIENQDETRKVFEIHPLSVSCIIASNNGSTLKIMFHYCTVLRIVTVVPTIESFTGIEQSLGNRILADEKILDELFPADFGKRSPNPDNEYQLEELGICNFYSLTKKIGFPYVWAQKVCGMEFLPFENRRESCTSIKTVMTAIGRRLAFRTSLAAQLQELEQNLLSKTPFEIDIPRTVLSVLFKWSSITWEDYCQVSSTADLRLHKLVSHNDLFYSAVIKRNDLANLHAFIAIKSDYPIQTPTFTLIVKFNSEFHSGNCDGVRDMERAVNVMTDPFNPRWLLSTQLHHLCAYFDIFLETTFTCTFTQKMAFFKNVRGRNRMRPFNFQNIGTGFFSHYKPSKVTQGYAIIVSYIVQFSLAIGCIMVTWGYHPTVLGAPALLPVCTAIIIIYRKPSAQRTTIMLYQVICSK